MARKKRAPPNSPAQTLKAPEKGQLSEAIKLALNAMTGVGVWLLGSASVAVAVQQMTIEVAGWIAAIGFCDIIIAVFIAEKTEKRRR
jgi:hypothetical protein